MSATVTVVGTIGPGLTLPSQAFTGVTKFSFDCSGDDEMLVIEQDQKVTTVAIPAAVTITLTTSGTTYTLTVANS
jgi:hypothetical protein